MISTISTLCSLSAFSAAVGCVSISCMAEDTLSHVVACKAPDMRCSHCNRKSYCCTPTPPADLFQLRRQLCRKSFNATPLLLSLAGSQLKWASKAHSVSLWSSPSAQRIVCTLSSMVLPCKAASIFTQTLLADLEIENSEQLLLFPSQDTLWVCSGSM